MHSGDTKSYNSCQEQHRYQKIQTHNKIHNKKNIETFQNKRASQFCNFSALLFDQKSPVHATYRLNRPRSRFIENLPLSGVLGSTPFLFPCIVFFNKDWAETTTGFCSFSGSYANRKYWSISLRLMIGYIFSV